MRIKVVMLSASGMAARGETRIRVADYNIKILSVESLQSKPQRKARLESVIEGLAAQIIGLQEIKDRAALEQLFSLKTGSILIDDDSNDAQDLDADDADYLFPGSNQMNSSQ